MKRAKKNLITLAFIPFLTISTSLLLSKSNVKSDALEVNAVAHVDNFDSYTYSGSYYSSITASGEGLNGSLREQLSNKIVPASYPTYSGNSGSTALAKLLQGADEDPTNSENMIYFYTRDSVKKNAASSWNREHVWPQSLSGGNWGKTQGGCDLLHIRPTYNSVNSSRGNTKYGDLNHGGSAKTYNGLSYGWMKNSIYEPLDANKGDCARIIMYLYVAYQNVYSSMPEITNVFESYDTLLTWHINDKPDALEGHRNDFAESSIQKNRNPFVDKPSYACKIFGSKASESVRNLCNQTYPYEGGDTPDVKAESIKIDNPISTIKVGESYTFKTTISPSEASQSVIWSSLDNEIISFNDNVATAHKVGEVTLKVASIENSEIFSELKVNVDNDDNNDDNNDDKKKRTIIVISSIAAGIFILAGILVLAVFLIRKRK